MKAAIQLDQLESRAGTVTWRRRQSKAREALSQRDFCGLTTHHPFYGRKTQYSERGRTGQDWWHARSQTARTLTHPSPLPSDRTCLAGSSRLCPFCPWWERHSIWRESRNWDVSSRSTRFRSSFPTRRRTHTRSLSPHYSPPPSTISITREAARVGSKRISASACVTRVPGSKFSAILSVATKIFCPQVL